jgi:hypothetical protein
VTRAAALAASLIAEIRAAGGTIRRHGDRIRVMARGPLPPDLVTRYCAARPELLGALADAAEIADWRNRHCEALAHWRPLYPAGEAERISWGELEARWHRLYGGRVPEWQCTGCGEPIGGQDALALGDGCRVHLDDVHGLDCLAAYGERWRGDANRGLAAMGLQPPDDGDESEAPVPAAVRALHRRFSIVPRLSALSQNRDPRARVRAGRGSEAIMTTTFRLPRARTRAQMRADVGVGAGRMISLPGSARYRAR